MKTILIAGGSGLVGKHLSRMLREKGYRVILYSRKEDLKGEFPAYAWDPIQGRLDTRALEQADVIINLAGAGIADARWTEARKKYLTDSRVASARLLKTSLEANETPVKAYLSASAIGYYGNRGDVLLYETDQAGGFGFLPKIVSEWEQAIASIESTGIRTVIFRIGIVLSTKGGALEKILLPFKFFNGTYFGDGSMWYSWIHIDDMVRMFIYAIEHETVSGTYNAVAPNPVTNKELVYACKKALGQPALITPAPAFALRAAMGEMADMILDSTRVSAEKIEKSGFRFSFPEILPALQDLIKRKV